MKTVRCRMVSPRAFWIQGDSTQKRSHVPTGIREAFLNLTLISGKTEQPPKPSLPAAVVMCRVHRAFVDLNCLLTGRPGLLNTGRPEVLI